MKSCSTALQNLLAGTRNIARIDLYTFELSGGSILRYTSAEVDVLADGHLYYGRNAPIFERGRIRTVRGVEVDDLDVSVYAGTQHTVNGVPWKEAIATGALDGAWLTLSYAFSAEPGEPIVGVMPAFIGRIADTETFTSGGRLKVRSALELLDSMVPRDLYQPGCLNILFDTGCAVARAAYQASATVATGSGQSVLLCNLTAADDYYALGEILFTGGANAGVRRTVRAYITGQVSLSYPLPKPVTVGDTFTAWPGCDGRQDTCSGKFSNQARFRAFPFVPVPETAV